MHSRSSNRASSTPSLLYPTLLALHPLRGSIQAAWPSTKMMMTMTTKAMRSRMMMTTQAAPAAAPAALPTVIAATRRYQAPRQLFPLHFPERARQVAPTRVTRTSPAAARSSHPSRQHLRATSLLQCDKLTLPLHHHPPRHQRAPSSHVPSNRVTSPNLHLVVVCHSLSHSSSMVYALAKMSSQPRHLLSSVSHRHPTLLPLAHPPPPPPLLPPRTWLPPLLLH